MANPRTTDYLAKLRTYIREVEKIIARQKAAAARLNGDKADLTQRLLRWLEHMQASQMAELARVEKIITKSQRTHRPTRPAASGDPGPSMTTNSALNTNAAEARVVTRRPAIGSGISNGRGISSIFRKVRGRESVCRIAANIDAENWHWAELDSLFATHPAPGDPVACCAKPQVRGHCYLSAALVQ
jgi:hypothetical protein